MELIEMFRIAHGINVLYKIVDYALSSPEKFEKFMFSQKMFETISHFVYFVASMYGIWALSKFDLEPK